MFNQFKQQQSHFFLLCFDFGSKYTIKMKIYNISVANLGQKRIIQQQSTLNYQL